MTASVLKPVETTTFMPVHYVFSDRDRDAIRDALEAITVSPYADLPSFMTQVGASRRALGGLADEIREMFRQVDYDENPACFLKNCPIDRNLPVFDHEDPVASKYERKTTFVTEGFLAWFGAAVGTHPVAYATINNGDLFHDMYLKNALKETHSQKSMTSIGFHNDLPNNKVRPNWVNIICLRNHPANKVSTTFIRNADIVASLGEEVLDVLRRPVFYTEPEVIAVHGGKDRNDIVRKPVYYPDSQIPFVYFEKRTASDDPDGQRAIRRLDQVLHACKERIFLEPGDLVSINNSTCIHGREVIEIADLEEHKKRWLMKTWNVDSLDDLDPLLLPGHYRTVDE